MSGAAVLILAMVAAAVVCGALLSFLPTALRLIGLVDDPGDRSSHSVPTPRGGGLAVLAGLLAGVAVWVVGTPGPVLGDPGSGADALVLLVAGVAVGAGAVGFADDVRDVRPAVRAVLQLVVGALAGAVVVQLLGLSVVWVPVAALCLAAYVNAVNFMDGVDTITAWHGVVVGLAFAVAGTADAARTTGTGGPGTAWLVPTGLLLAVVCAVFLPANGVRGTRARVFLGDVGSYAVGAVIAVMAGAGFLCGLPVVTVLAPLTVWLVDTGHTLLLRAAAGEPPGTAHRTHAYQRLVDAGWSHRRVGALAAAATGSCAAAGLVTLWVPALQLVGLVVPLAVGWVWVKLPAWRGRPSPWGAVLQHRIRGGR